MKIEVGMMVGIVFVQRGNRFIGCVGIVKARNSSTHYAVRLESGERLSAHINNLRPINDDDEQASWKQVKKITGWQPKETEHALL